MIATSTIKIIFNQEDRSLVTYPLCLLHTMKFTTMNAFSALLVATLVSSLDAFAPVSHTFRPRTVPTTSTSSFQEFAPAALQRQRKSVAQVQTMSLFGIGAPELALILVAAAFFLGPQKLAELGKDAGKIAGELKEVPKEFQKGLAEGEKEAKVQAKALEAEMSVTDEEESKEE